MKSGEKIFLALVVVFALAFAGMALAQFEKAVSLLVSPAKEAGAQGKARDVDMQKVRRMIDEGTLSDHEAQFYKKASAAIPGQKNAKPIAPYDTRTPPLKLVIPPNAKP